MNKIYITKLQKKTADLHLKEKKTDHYKLVKQKKKKREELGVRYSLFPLYWMLVQAEKINKALLHVLYFWSWYYRS